MKNLVLLAAVLAISVGFSQAVLSKIYVLEDTYADNAMPFQQFGLEETTWQFAMLDNNAQPSGRQFYHFVKYNISTLPTNISRALDYHKQTYTPSSEFYAPGILFNLTRVRCNWTETTLTWNNQPAVINTISLDYQDWDTDYVIGNVTTDLKNARLAGETLYCLRYSSNLYDMVETWSKDAQGIAPGEYPYIEYVAYP